MLGCLKVRKVIRSVLAFEYERESSLLGKCLT